MQAASRHFGWEKSRHRLEAFSPAKRSKFCSEKRLREHKGKREAFNGIFQPKCWQTPLSFPIVFLTVKAPAISCYFPHSKAPTLLYHFPYPTSSALSHRFPYIKASTLSYHFPHVPKSLPFSIVFHLLSTSKSPHSFMAFSISKIYSTL